MPIEVKRRARAAALALLGILTLAGYGLLRRKSAPAVIFGFYSLEYFAILVAFGGAWLFTLYLTLRPSARVAGVAARAAGWLRKRWWLAALLFYGALEGWFALIDFRGLAFAPITARRTFMTALLLLLFWALLVLLFAGLSETERRNTAGLLGFTLTGMVVIFWMVALLDSQVLSREKYRAYHDFWTALFRYDYELGYRGRPNTEYENPNCEAQAGQVTIFTDDLGYRNLPGARSAPLVVVGDSFIYDPCHAYEDMWSTQLGEALGVEVANYSTAGASLWHYLKYTDLFVRQGDHEVLVYGLYANDLIDDANFENSLHDRLAWTGTLYYRSPLTFAGRRYLTESPIRQIVGGIERARRGPPPPKQVVPLDNGILLEKETGFTQYFGPDTIVGERLEAAIAYAEEMDLEFVVVTIPSKRSVYVDNYVEGFPDSADLPERENAVFEELCDWLAERDVLCLNLTADMREAAAEGDALYFSVDPHWNAAGSRVAADLTADFLRENLDESVWEN